PPDRGNFFMPAPDPAANIWFSRDPAAMAPAIAIPLERLAPFTVDSEAVAPGGLPQGGETVVSFTNNHLHYAITWYGLAAALVAVSFVYVRSLRSQQG